MKKEQKEITIDFSDAEDWSTPTKGNKKKFDEILEKLRTGELKPWDIELPEEEE